MKILFVQKGVSLFASSGEYRANIALLRHLAHLGHETAQICFALEGEVDLCIKQVGGIAKANLTRTELPLPMPDGTVVEVPVHMFTDVDGIRIIALDGDRFREAFPRKRFTKETRDYIEDDVLSPQMHAFVAFINTYLAIIQPTHIMFNDSLTLKATSTMPLPLHTKRIFVIHCAEQLPFGPYAGGLPDSAVSPKETELLHHVDGIWAASQAVKDYAWEHGKLESTFIVHDKWTYLSEKTHDMPPEYHNWDKDVIGMINPSEVKGVKILIELAKRLPHVKFATWVSWGFNAEVRKRLEAVPNIELRPTCRNMEELWSQVKILIVPSVWLEVWGMVVTEAQMRGIPVISSNAGGLPEAKLGIPYIIPVNMLTGAHDDNGSYIVPEQDIDPWVTTLERLRQDKDLYESISYKSRTKTRKWVSELDEKAHEKFLESVVKKPATVEL